MLYHLKSAEFIHFCLSSFLFWFLFLTSQIFLTCKTLIETVLKVESYKKVYLVMSQPPPFLNPMPTTHSFYYSYCVCGLFILLIFHLHIYVYVLKHIILEITPYQFTEVSSLFSIPVWCVHALVSLITLFCIDFLSWFQYLQLKIMLQWIILSTRTLVLLEANLQGKPPKVQLSGSKSKCKCSFVRYCQSPFSFFISVCIVTSNTQEWDRHLSYGEKTH